MENTKPTGKIITISVMFDMGDSAVMSSPVFPILHSTFAVEDIAVGIVEVVCDYAKGVDLQVLEEVLGDFV